MTEERLMFARDDLRKKMADVLAHADEGKIVSIGSRWKTQSLLHIMNDERLGQLTTAADELKRLQQAEATTVQGRLAARLRHALTLLQEVNQIAPSYGRDPITPEGIARTLGLETISSFEDFLCGRASAPFSLLHKFADRYGFSRQWLEDGSGTIFPRQTSSARLLDKAFELGLECGYCDRRGLTRLHFHFILFEGGAQWPIHLFIGNGQFGWQMVNGNWFLDHRRLGGGGQGQQLEFYELLQELKAASIWYEVSSSVFTSPKDYESFWREEHHPAWFLQQRKQEQGWTDDLMNAVEDSGYQGWIESHYKEKAPFFDTVHFIQKILEDESRSYYRERIEATRERRWRPESHRREEEACADAERTEVRAGATGKPRPRIRRAPPRPTRQRVQPSV